MRPLSVQWPESSHSNEGDGIRRCWYDGTNFRVECTRIVYEASMVRFLRWLCLPLWRVIGIDQFNRAVYLRLTAHAIASLWEGFAGFTGPLYDSLVIRRPRAPGDALIRAPPALDCRLFRLKNKLHCPGNQREWLTSSFARSFLHRDQPIRWTVLVNGPRWSHTQRSWDVGPHNPERRVFHDSCKVGSSIARCPPDRSRRHLNNGAQWSWILEI